MPDARLQRTRDAYQDDSNSTNRERYCAPFPGGYDVEEIFDESGKKIGIRRVIKQVLVEPFDVMVNR